MVKVLGIDFGLKKIGLAIDESSLPEPLGILRVKGSFKRIIQQIASLCQKEKVEKIVIGLPESGLVEKIKKFGKNLEKETNLPVFYHPETLTTKDALAKMKEVGIKGKARRKKEDAIAAALILQDWLNKNV